MVGFQLAEGQRLIKASVKRAEEAGGGEVEAAPTGWGGRRKLPSFQSTLSGSGSSRPTPMTDWSGFSKPQTAIASHSRPGAPRR